MRNVERRMQVNTVQQSTVDRNLCVSCGVCKSVCPQGAIKYIKVDGSYIPKLNNQCISCGLCVKICPGVSTDYLQLYENMKEPFPENILVGNVRSCYNASTKDSIILQNATSGGIVTTLINECLHQKLVDSAFCVDTYDYSGQVVTSRYVEGNNFTNTQKSRYIPISHENLVTYMIQNPTEKIIITATSCAIHGILKIIDLYKLDRKNYFLVGLFCDKVMSYNIQDYFDEKVGDKIQKLFFRDKMVGGWPGNISILLQNGRKIELAAIERMKVKKYFQLERCLYCIDKLNQFSDISIGDNYTRVERGILESSVIVRTDIGQEIWEKCVSSLNYKEITIGDIIKSQAVENRKKNAMMAGYYEKRYEHCINILPKQIKGKLSKKTYVKQLHDIELGKNYLKEPEKLHRKVHVQDQKRYIFDKMIGIRSKLGEIKRKLWCKNI